MKDDGFRPWRSYVIFFSAVAVMILIALLLPSGPGSKHGSGGSGGTGMSAGSGSGGSGGGTGGGAGKNSGAGSGSQNGPGAGSGSQKEKGTPGSGKVPLPANPKSPEPSAVPQKAASAGTEQQTSSAFPAKSSPVQWKTDRKTTVTQKTVWNAVLEHIKKLDSEKSRAVFPDFGVPATSIRETGGMMVVKGFFSPSDRKEKIIYFTVTFHSDGYSFSDLSFSAAP